MSWRPVWALQGMYWKTPQTMLHHTAVKIIWWVSQRDKGKLICVSNQHSLFGKIIILSIRLSFISEDFLCLSCHFWFGKYSFLTILLFILFLYIFLLWWWRVHWWFVPLTHSQVLDNIWFFALPTVETTLFSLRNFSEFFDWVVRREKRDR